MNNNKATTQNLIASINSLPEELLKSSMTGANAKWTSHKIKTVRRYQTLDEINTKSKTWKRIADVALESPIKTTGLPKIDARDPGSCPEGWSGYMEISEKGTTVCLSKEIKTAGVIFNDIVTEFGRSQSPLEKLLVNSIENSNERLKSLAYSLADHGFYLSVPEGFRTEKPFKIVFTLSGSANIMPLLFATELGKGSSIKLLLEFISDKSDNRPCFVPLTHIGKLGDESELELVEIQDLGSEALFFPNEAIEIGEKAVLNRFIMDKGSRMLHRAFSADFCKTGGSGTVTGVYFPRTEQRYFYDTKQNHSASNTTSSLLFKGVLDDAAFAEWKGNILVAEGVRGADGYQLSNTLLLNQAAHAESIPGLEISTDDVKCSHGVTISSVDKDQLFYLQTRGIDEAEGKKLIVDGFIRSALNRIKSIELQNYIKGNLDKTEEVF